MKGLIIKDLLCMRKSLLVFIYVILSVFVVSVMFVLSSRFGNIATSMAQSVTDGSMTSVDVKAISVYVLSIFMVIPMAICADLSVTFKLDNLASFNKVSTILPVSAFKRVLAKYLTVFIMIGIGAVCDILMAGCLSLLTDAVNFMEFIGIITSSAAIMLIFISISITYQYLFKAGTEDYAVIVALITTIALGVLSNFSSVKAIWLSLVNGNPSMDGFNKLMFTFRDKSYVIMLAAIAITIITYFLSVLIVKRKRGIA